MKSIRLSSLILSVPVICLCLSINVSAQEQDPPPNRAIVTIPSAKNCPVRIYMVRSDAGDLQLDKGVTAGPNWLKNLTISLVNEGAPFNHIYLTMHFRRPAEEKNKVHFGHDFQYGESPFADETGEFLVNTAEPVARGATFEFTLSDDDHQRIIDGLAKGDYPIGHSSVVIFVNTVGYSDGTVWKLGRYYGRIMGLILHNHSLSP